MIDLSTLLPPVSVSANSEIGRLLVSRDLPLTLEQHRVMGTRSMARTVLELLPQGPVTLDCAHIDVMSPPFIHELIKSRSDLAFDNMNPDVKASWDLAYEHLMSPPFTV